MRQHANRTGPQLRWIHESNSLSGRREIVEACPGGRDRVIILPVLWSFWQPRSVEHGRRKRLKWPDRPPSVCVCMGELYTRRMSTVAGSLRTTKHWRAAAQSNSSHEDSARRQVWCIQSARRQAVQSCDDKTLRAVRQQILCSVASDLLTSIRNPPLPSSSSSMHC